MLTEPGLVNEVETQSVDEQSEPLTPQFCEELRSVVRASVSSWKKSDDLTPKELVFWGAQGVQTEEWAIKLIFVFQQQL